MNEVSRQNLLMEDQYIFLTSGEYYELNAILLLLLRLKVQKYEGINFDSSAGVPYVLLRTR